MPAKIPAWLAVLAISTTLLIVMAVAFNSYTMPPRPNPRCPSNLKQIGVAMEMYTSAWGDTRPPLHTTDQRAPNGEAWPDLLVPYLKRIEPQSTAEGTANLFRCPDSIGDRLTYSLNPMVAGLGVRKMRYPSSTICLFDSVNDSPENNNLNGGIVWQPSDLGVPPVGSLVIWPERERFWGPKLPAWAKPRHHGRTNILWVDGHVCSISLSEMPDFELQFDPMKKPRQGH